MNQQVIALFFVVLLFTSVVQVYLFLLSLPLPSRHPHPGFYCRIPSKLIRNLNSHTSSLDNQVLLLVDGSVILRHAKY